MQKVRGYYFFLITSWTFFGEQIPKSAKTVHFSDSICIYARSPIHFRILSWRIHFRIVVESWLVLQYSSSRKFLHITVRRTKLPPQALQFELRKSFPLVSTWLICKWQMLIYLTWYLATFALIVEKLIVLFNKYSFYISGYMDSIEFEWAQVHQERQPANCLGSPGL